MSSFLSSLNQMLASLNLPPLALAAIGLVVLAVAVVVLVVWLTVVDRRTRGVVDGLEVERRKVAEMQVLLSQMMGQAPGSRRPRGAAGRGGARPAQGQARPQTPGASRVGVPQNAAMGSQRARAAQQAPTPQRSAAPGAGAPAAGAAAQGRSRQIAPRAASSQEEQVFAAWVQERAQAMEQGSSRSGRARSRSAAGGRDGRNPHEFSVPRGADLTGGVPMEQWTGPVGRGSSRDRQAAAARQATAAARSQAARPATDPRARQGAGAGASRGAARPAADPRARQEAGARSAARDPRAQAGAGRATDPRAQARPAAGAGAQARAAGAYRGGAAANGVAGGAGAGASRGAAAGGVAGGAGAGASRGQQRPAQTRVADSRPWQNPRANARTGGRGGNPSNSGYVTVSSDFDAPRAGGNPSSPLQPRDARRPMTQPHPENRASEAPIPVQVEAASSTGLFRRKKADDGPRGKHAR